MLKESFGVKTVAVRLSGMVFVVALGLSLCTTVFGEDLTFSYTDPVGDSTGTIDVTHMVVVFDNITGNYNITLTSTAAQPFLGAFRVNINLFNANRLPDHSSFHDVFNDYNLANAQTELILTGIDANLPFWIAGDTITTNTLASGGVNPPGISFYRTQVTNFPPEAFTNEDAVAYDLPGIAAITVVTPQAPVGGNLLRNPAFAGNLSWWVPQSGVISFDSTRNASGAQSGSLKSINNVDQSSNPFCNNSNICVTVFPAQQCILVTPGVTYAFGGEVFIPSGQSSSGQGGVGISFWNNTICGGTSVGFSDGSPVTSTGRWVLSSGKVQAPPGAVSARVLMNNGRIEKTGALQVNFDDMFFREATAADCVISNPGNPIPVRTTGWSNSFRNGSVALGFIATNSGVASVLNPFVQILLWQFTTVGAPVTVSPTTTCFGPNPMPYVPLADVLRPGRTAQKALVFNTPPGLRFLRVDYLPYVQIGLQ